MIESPVIKAFRAFARFGLVCLFALTLTACGGATGDPGGGSSVVAQKNGAFPEVVIETEKGNIRFEMLVPTTPITGETVSGLILSGWYDNESFYDVRPGVLAQFGPDETIEGRILHGLPQEFSGEPLDRGAVALAWVGSKERPSQRIFFPLSRLDATLDNEFTVFGRITEGMNVLDQLVQGDTSLSVSVRLTRPVFRIKTVWGSIIVEMAPDRAPNTVERISDLVCQGFYNGLRFHRVEPQLIQGGDPLNNGTGGSGQTIPAEFNKKRFRRAFVGMARGPEEDSADSQFFIMKQTTRELDGNYTNFGKVISGMGIVDIIRRNDRMIDVSLQFDLNGRDCNDPSAPATGTTNDGPAGSSDNTDPNIPNNTPPSA
ncbi:MAG: peptidylprolyl isomerase [Leptospirillia bacterium]